MSRPFSSNDQQWLAHALALARRGRALSSPNPMVGAVLVRNRRVVGEGFHAYDAMQHAEIVALEAAGAAARRSTLYVNLEPCCTTGRTGPCTQALIQGGVARVVASISDPNPAIAGRGFKQLRSAGIEVEIGVCRADAQRLNEAFAMWITTGRPFVTLKSGLTLDGQLVLPVSKKNTGGPNKAARWITSAESREEVQHMRHASDAVMTGIGTVLADDPLLTDRTGMLRRRPLLRVVLDSRLRINPRSKLVRTAHEDVLVFTCAAPDSPRAKALRRAGVDVVNITGRGDRPDLYAVLAQLGKRKITSVLLEAGATLNQAALDADLIDKVRLFYAPKLVGALPGVLNRKNVKTKIRGNTPAPVRDLSGLRIQQFGPDFAVEGYLHDVYGNR